MLKRIEKLLVEGKVVDMEKLLEKVIKVKDKGELNENMDLKVDKHHYKLDYQNLDFQEKQEITIHIYV